VLFRSPAPSPDLPTLQTCSTKPKVRTKEGAEEITEILWKEKAALGLLAHAPLGWMKSKAAKRQP